MQMHPEHLLKVTLLGTLSTQIVLFNASGACISGQRCRHGRKLQVTGNGKNPQDVDNCSSDSSSTVARGVRAHISSDVIHSELMNRLEWARSLLVRTAEAWSEPPRISGTKSAPRSVTGVLTSDETPQFDGQKLILRQTMLTKATN
jgi:hypothetical protein